MENSQGKPVPSQTKPRQAAARAVLFPILSFRHPFSLCVGSVITALGSQDTECHRGCQPSITELPLPKLGADTGPTSSPRILPQTCPDSAPPPAKGSRHVLEVQVHAASQAQPFHRLAPRQHRESRAGNGVYTC